MSEPEDWTFRDYFLDEYADAIKHTPPYKHYEIDTIYTFRKDSKKISVYWRSLTPKAPTYVYEGRHFNDLNCEDGPIGVYIWMMGYLPKPLEDKLAASRDIIGARRGWRKNYTLEAAIQYFARMGVRLTRNGPYKEINMSGTRDGDGRWLSHSRPDEGEYKGEAGKEKC